MPLALRVCLPLSLSGVLPQKLPMNIPVHKRRNPVQCVGKTKYKSIRKAKTGVRILRESGEAVHPYACPLCGWYHVGH